MFIRFKLLFFVLLFSFLNNGYAADYPDFTRLVEKYGAAVVNISTTQHTRNVRGIEDVMPGFPFFGQPPQPKAPRGQAPREQAPRDRNSQSLGSGFISAPMVM